MEGKADGAAVGLLICEEGLKGGEVEVRNDRVAVAVEGWAHPCGER